MALKWLRQHQKRVLIPLSVVVIIVFVFLFGAGGRRGDDSGSVIVAEVGGRKITRNEYSEYLRILRALRYNPRPRAAYEFLRRAEVARRAGLRIGAEELRDRVRMIVKSVLRPGPGELTEAEYREALGRLSISPSAFEEFMEAVLLAETMPQIVASASRITDDEYYLAYCREGELIALKKRDFLVAAFEKDVEKPTDEEVQEFYDEHKDLKPELETAFATEPKVSVEYAFAEKKLAGRLAQVLAEYAPLTHQGGLTAGPLGSLSSGITHAAMAAVRESEIRQIYDRDKEGRYKLPDKPKEPEESAEPKAEEGQETAEGQEGQGEEPEEPPEPRYKPLDEVRGEIAKEVDSRLENPAARQAADRFVETIKDRSRLRTFEADSLAAGLGLAGLPAALGSSGLWDRADFMSACGEAGVTYGVSGLKTEDALKTFAPLVAPPRSTWSIANSAVSNAKAGSGGRLSGTVGVANGSVVWRVADHAGSRTLTLEEAKDAVVKRIVHARAEKKARDAAMDFITELVEGTADLKTLMDAGDPLHVSYGHIKPFVSQGVNEIPRLPVAFKENTRDVVTEEDRESNEELAAMHTERYRVAVVSQRNTPDREKFEKACEGEPDWRTGRSARMLPFVRRTFMTEHWEDETREKVHARFYADGGGRR